MNDKKKLMGSATVPVAASGVPPGACVERRKCLRRDAKDCGRDARAPLMLILLFILCLVNSALAQPIAISTNKSFMLNNGLGGTTNNKLTPAVSNFFDVNSPKLHDAIVNLGVVGGAGPPGLSANGPANTALVYDSAGHGVGTNNEDRTVVGDLFPDSVTYISTVANDAGHNVVTGVDSDGNFSIFNPFGVVNIDGSAFGAGGDGTLQANLFNGAIPVTDLDSGVNADSMHFWRGDGVWAVPSGGGGSQTPITQDVNYAQYSLTNVQRITFTNNAGGTVPGAQIHTDVVGQTLIIAPAGIEVDKDSDNDNSGRLTSRHLISVDLETLALSLNNSYFAVADPGTGNAPNFVYRVSTNYRGADFTFTAPANISDVAVGGNEAVFTDFIVSNTSGSTITASFPVAWSNNWQGGGGTASIPAHGVQDFTITIIPSGILALTNVSWLSPSGGSGNPASGDGTTATTNVYGVISVIPAGVTNGVDAALRAALIATNTTVVADIVAATNAIAANSLTGTIATARLGSGTANGTTVLFGDQTYKTAVTSVTFTGDGVIDSATPSSAVTASGTVAATAINQSANTILAGPVSGSMAAPTFRALNQSDLPPSAITNGDLNSIVTISPGKVALTNSISWASALSNLWSGGMTWVASALGHTFSFPNGTNTMITPSGILQSGGAIQGPIINSNAPIINYGSGFTLINGGWSNQISQNPITGDTVVVVTNQFIGGGSNWFAYTNTSISGRNANVCLTATLQYFCPTNGGFIGTQTVSLQYSITNAPTQTTPVAAAGVVNTLNTHAAANAALTPAFSANAAGNVVVFVGGPTSATNLFAKLTITASQF